MNRQASRDRSLFVFIFCFEKDKLLNWKCKRIHKMMMIHIIQYVYAFTLNILQLNNFCFGIIYIDLAFYSVEGIFLYINKLLKIKK